MSLKEARAALVEATKGRDSQLCRWAPTIFSGQRLDLFMACYMAMRRIDDQIDELASEERHQDSPALAVIDDWQDKVERAARGEVDRTCCEDLAIWHMLAARLPKAGFDGEPFKALAMAMRHDAKGLELTDWPEFLAYCEGATVAPTAIYLTLMHKKNRKTAFDTIWSWAQPLAHFCYVAHIMRDLRKDAQSGAHLLTLPYDLFEDLAPNRFVLAQRLALDDHLLATLSRRLLDQLPPILSALAPILQPTRAALTMPSNLVLSRLLKHYGGVMEQIAQNIGYKEFAMPHFISGKGSPI